ncbi:hypothetical protein Leryth_023553 [Lithospermum erythrorhizon]|nr:hypothetical protein Leryth_023553 [Lithospermum erythrorhizon]
MTRLCGPETLISIPMENFHFAASRLMRLWRIKARLKLAKMPLLLELMMDMVARKSPSLSVTTSSSLIYLVRFLLFIAGFCRFCYLFPNIHQHVIFHEHRFISDKFKLAGYL